MQGPPAGVTCLPVRAVELHQLLLEGHLANGGHIRYIVVYTCSPFRLR
jgi:hypothetical protein